MEIKYADGVTPGDISGATSNSTRMLLAMAALGKHIYPGTVARAVVDRRRKKNRAARIARRAHRG